MPSSKNIDRAFGKIEFKGLALDAYLTSKISVVRKVANEEFTYGYRKVRADGSLTKKFATLMTLRGIPALVLHIGEKTEKEGLRLQKKVDKKLERVYERNRNQIDEKTHEVFIRLDWVNDVADLKPFIDEVYEKRN